MTERAKGTDVSKWNYPYFPKGDEDFIIQRTSYGMVVDEKLVQMQPAVMQAPITGAYHYVSSAAPWRAQADLFLSLSEKYDFLAWDVEKSYNVGSSLFIGGIVPAMTYLAEVSKKPVLTYCNPDMWNTWFVPIQKDLLKFDLWFARYWFIRSNVNPAVPSNMRQDWKFWQWNDRGVDENVFCGTADELRAWAKPGTVTPPVALTLEQRVARLEALHNIT